MAVLVSGASGFLGSQLLNRLLDNSEEVVAISRLPVPLMHESNPMLHWIVRDIALDGIDSRELPDIRCVVHLAGATLGAGTNEQMFLFANELTTVRLLEALADRTDRFVFASSQVVYGDACCSCVTEEFPLRADSTAYACSKVNSENWMRWFHRCHGGQYTILRFSGFIDGGGLVDYMIDRALAGEPIELYSQGRVCRDYLPSVNAVDVLVAAINYSGQSEFLPVNIGSGQAVSALELARIICAELQSNSQITLSATPSPQGDFVFSIERATELFDFRPGSLADVVRTYARCKQHQMLLQGGNAKN